MSEVGATDYYAAGCVSAATLGATRPDSGTLGARRTHKWLCRVAGETQPPNGRGIGCAAAASPWAHGAAALLQACDPRWNPTSPSTRCCQQTRPATLLRHVHPAQGPVRRPAVATETPQPPARATAQPHWLTPGPTADLVPANRPGSTRQSGLHNEPTPTTSPLRRESSPHPPLTPARRRHHRGRIMLGIQDDGRPDPCQRGRSTARHRPSVGGIKILSTAGH